ncbi:MAG TPA: LytTR family DNA-binding domain-containing protein [Gemmatimonadaceae bacterium]
MGEATGSAGSTVKVLIADDEPLARRRSARLLRERDDVEIVAQCSGGAEAAASIRALAPDLVLLDIQMPDLDGFGVIAEVGLEQMPQVVFVTAYDEHAIRAFEINAVDYLVKPYTPERFNAAVDRAVEMVELRSRSISEQAAEDSRMLALMQRVFGEEEQVPGSDRIIVRDKDRMRLVRARDIDWIESEANYVRLHTAAGSYLIRGNLGKLEEKLGAFGFARVHRRFLVNLDRVSEVQPWFGGDAIVVLTNKTKVRLSRTFRENFEKRFLSP